MNNPSEHIVIRYCCGWCGVPTDVNGEAIKDIPTECLPLWSGAVSVNGKCCEDDIRNQEQYEREMMSALYRDA